MQVPPEISFRDVDKTPDIEELIGEQFARLELVHDRIVSSRLAVEKTQSHQKRGSPYRVRLNVRVPPGHELVFRHEPTEGHLHEELHKILRDVFEAARRRLRELIELQRGETKSHPEQDENLARVARLFSAAGYGFLSDTDGREVYFHRNSVIGEFDDLEVGTSVRYVSEMGQKGPQATTVKVVSRPMTRAAEAPEPGRHARP